LNNILFCVWMSTLGCDWSYISYISGHEKHIAPAAPSALHVMSDISTLRHHHELHSTHEHTQLSRWVTMQAGLATVKLVLNGGEPPGSPFPAKISAGPVAPYSCTFEGPDLVGCVLGAACSFLVASRDAFGMLAPHTPTLLHLFRLLLGRHTVLTFYHSSPLLPSTKMAFSVSKTEHQSRMSWSTFSPTQSHHNNRPWSYPHGHNWQRPLYFWINTQMHWKTSHA